MSGARYGIARRDNAEPEIVKALEAHGASVTRLDGKGLPDLLVGWAGLTLLMEVKTGNAGLTDEQVRWHKAWLGQPVAIVRTPAQAVKALAMARPALADVLRAEGVVAACAEDAIRFGKKTG